jgi:hypothetical protein
MFFFLTFDARIFRLGHGGLHKVDQIVVWRLISGCAVDNGVHAARFEDSRIRRLVAVSLGDHFCWKHQELKKMIRSLFSWKKNK